MEWKLTMYPVLAVVLGLLLISSVDVLVPKPQTFTRQSLGNQSKEVSPGAYPSEAQAGTQSQEINLSSDGSVTSLEMLTIGLVLALGVYLVARHRFS